MEAGNGLDAVEMAKNRPTGALAVGMVGPAYRIHPDDCLNNLRRQNCAGTTE